LVVYLTASLLFRCWFYDGSSNHIHRVIFERIH
jgi:hypothetical protein